MFPFASSYNTEPAPAASVIVLKRDRAQKFIVSSSGVHNANVCQLVFWKKEEWKKCEKALSSS